MRCPSANDELEILLDHAAGKLNAQAAREFTAHLQVCGACRDLAAAQQSLWKALDSLEETPISPDFNRRLYARIEAEENSRSFASRWVGSLTARWFPFSWRPLMPAAAVCATLAAALFLQIPAPRPLMTAEEGPVQIQAQKIDADQVERALDDLDMLKQLGTPARPENAGSM